MGIKHNHTATGTNDANKQVSVNRWNEDHIIDSQINLPKIASPSTPAANTAGVYIAGNADKMVPAFIDPTGTKLELQRFLGSTKFALWSPPGNSTTNPTPIGAMNAPTLIGTATSRSVGTTNIATRLARLGIVSSAAAGNFAALREGSNRYVTGNGVGLGGFFYSVRFTMSNAAGVAGERCFIGLSNSTAAPTNVEPNTLTNVIGLVKLSSSNNWLFYSAAGSAGTATNLGVNFPANTLSTDAYEFSMYAKPNGTLGYKLVRLNTAFFVENTVSAVNLPTNTTLLGHQIWKTNNATALAVGIDIASIYVESDN